MRSRAWARMHANWPRICRARQPGTSAGCARLVWLLPEHLSASRLPTCGGLPCEPWCGPAGAELGNVLNEAALEAVRRGGKEIVQRDVDFAVDRVLQVREMMT